jgi:hypothetical protein
MDRLVEAIRRAALVAGIIIVVVTAFDVLMLC